VTTMPLLREPELAAITDISRPSVTLCDHRFTDAASGLGLVVPYGGNGPDDLTARCLPLPGTFDDVPTAGDDVALLAFTSGTTGQPKATMHFHRDVLAIADTFSRHVLRPEPDDRYVGSPPLGFTFGLGALLVFPLRFRGSGIMVEQPSPENLLEAIQRHRATCLFTAPVAY